MLELIRLGFLFLLVLYRTTAAYQTKNSSSAITLQHLNNVTSTSLVPHNINASYPEFPLFNPCYNPFPSDANQTYPVDPYWLKAGEHFISLSKLRLLSYAVTSKEHEWIETHAFPRLSFLWSLYQLAHTISSIDTTQWKLGLKHLVSHSIIRTIGYQKRYQLQLEAHYFSQSSRIAVQELKSMHVLILFGKNIGFVPLIIFNPPAFLLGTKAQGEKIHHYWQELVNHPNALIGDPSVNFLWIPYQHPQGINFTQVETIGIFSSFGQFNIPLFVSPKLASLVTRELSRFEHACVSFAEQEEQRYLKRFPTPPMPKTSSYKNDL